MSIEDLPRRDRTARTRSGVSVETIGSLMVLAGFAVGIFAMFLNSSKLAAMLTIPSVGLVVVGVVLAIAGKR